MGRMVSAITDVMDRLPRFTGMNFRSTIIISIIINCIIVLHSRLPYRVYPVIITNLLTLECIVLVEELLHFFEILGSPDLSSVHLIGQIHYFSVQSGLQGI